MKTSLLSIVFLSAVGAAGCQRDESEEALSFESLAASASPVVSPYPGSCECWAGREFSDFLVKVHLPVPKWGCQYFLGDYLRLYIHGLPGDCYVIQSSTHSNVLPDTNYVENVCPVP
jgi:hypothetical protein